MGDKTLISFGQIGEFLSFLGELFPRDKPLALYIRLVEKVKAVDKVAITKHIEVFKKFFEKYRDEIKKESLPENCEIVYKKSGKIDIYIKMGRFISNSNDENKQVIYKFLLTLLVLISPSEDALELLSEKSQTTQDFLNDILEDAQSKIGEVDTKDIGGAITKIVQSGIIEDTIQKFQKKSESGQTDPVEFLNSLQPMLAGMMGNLATKQMQNPLQDRKSGKELLKEIDQEYKKSAK